MNHEPPTVPAPHGRGKDGPFPFSDRGDAPRVGHSVDVCLGVPLLSAHARLMCHGVRVAGDLFLLVNGARDDHV